MKIINNIIKSIGVVFTVISMISLIGCGAKFFEVGDKEAPMTVEYAYKNIDKRIDKITYIKGYPVCYYTDTYEGYNLMAVYLSDNKDDYVGQVKKEYPFDENWLFLVMSTDDPLAQYLQNEYTEPKEKITVECSVESDDTGNYYLYENVYSYKEY